MTTYHLPKNETPIEYIYAALSIEEDGTEGIIASMLPGIGSCPMVFHKINMMNKFMPLIRKTVNETGRKVRIVKFLKTEILEEINP